MKTLAIDDKTKEQFDLYLSVFTFLHGTAQTHDSFIIHLLSLYRASIDKETLKYLLKLKKVI